MGWNLLWTGSGFGGNGGEKFLYIYESAYCFIAFGNPVALSLWKKLGEDEVTVLTIGKYKPYG